METPRHYAHTLDINCFLLVDDLLVSYLAQKREPLQRSLIQGRRGSWPFIQDLEEYQSGEWLQIGGS